MNNLNQEANFNNDVEIIKVDDSLNDNNGGNNNHNYSNNINHGFNFDSLDINKDSLFQFFDSKTKSTTTSGVNEKIISYYKQLCWEKEYFYPILILKLLILIIQDELCFKKKIKLLGLSPNYPTTSSNHPRNLQKHQKLIKNNYPSHVNNNIKIYNYSNPQYHLQQQQQHHHHQQISQLYQQKNKVKNNLNNNNNNNNNNNDNNNKTSNENEKPIIYTLYDHIETFPYINEYHKHSSNINMEINNEFSKHDLKFFNLIHTLFYDAFYEFEDCKVHYIKFCKYIYIYIHIFNLY